MEKLKQENAELKRLLRLAMGDFERLEQCCTCKNYESKDDPHCKKGCFYEWRYAAEAEKLLGGEEK